MTNQTILCRDFTRAVVFLLFTATSCSTPLQEVTYLKGIETGRTYEHGTLPDEYRIRANDHLYIRIIGVDQDNVAFLNLIGSQTSSIGSSYNLELITYLVDENGNIQYPFLGEINVSNMTLTEVQEILQQRVDLYLQNASVFVKLVSRTITVLGEVGNPGKISMVKSRMTVFETLGMAGDISDFGNYQNVKIIRELPEGKQIAEIDLTNPAILFSPYYYIQPHDIVYVEHRTRIYGAKNMPFTSPLTITASVISIGLLILNLFK
jgi:polysaccharide biosynthesis/export protein